MSSYDDTEPGAGFALGVAVAVLLAASPLLALGALVAALVAGWRPW